MTKDQIKVGGFYLAKVSGKLTTVRVDSIDGGPGRHLGYTYGGASKGYAYQARYRVTNMKTGRTTTFHSATKFRKEMPNPDITPINMKQALGRIDRGGPITGIDRGGPPPTDDNR